jgi:PKD repeat protein
MNGDTLWTRIIPDGGSSYAQSVVLNGTGYMIGGTGRENFLAISLDANGNVLWQQEYENGGLDRCYSMAASGSDFILAGYTSIFSNSNVMVLKIDSLGAELYRREFNRNQTDEAWSIQSIPTGGFIVAGRTVSSVSDDMYVIRTDCDHFPTVAISVLDTICLGGDTIASTLIDNNLSGVTYQWMLNDTFINGSNQSAFVATESGYYKLMATDSNGCNNFSNEILVDFPSPHFTINPQVACAGDIIKLGHFYYGVDPYNWYNWDLGDGNTDTGQFITHVYADTGWFYITRNIQTSNGSCNTFGDSIHITTTAIPPVDFDMLINSQNMLYNKACPGDVVSFTPYVYTYLFVPLPPFDATSYLWDFGDGTTDTAAYPTHQYSQTGMFAVSLTVTNHCGNSATQTDSILIDTNFAAVGTFLWVNGQGITNDTVQACEPVTFHSTGGSLYDWDFNDGSTNSISMDSILHAFATMGTYSVMLVVTNNCNHTDTVFHNVIVVGTCTDIPTPILEDASVQVFPNPFDVSATIRINSSVDNENFELNIYDLQGKNLLRKIVQSGEFKIDRTDLTGGIYFFSLRSSHGCLYGKFIVN